MQYAHNDSDEHITGFWKIYGRVLVMAIPKSGTPMSAEIKQYAH
jgi:hypothetical protein